MSWIAISDGGDRGAGAPMSGEPAYVPERFAQTLITTGSLVVEARWPESRRPRFLLRYDQIGDWPLHLALQTMPGGGLLLILDQGGEVLHQTLECCPVARIDRIRVTYSWDAPRRWGRLSVEVPGQDHVVTALVPNPQPFRLCDLYALAAPGPCRYAAPEISFVAVSDVIEPVGPMPSLAPDTPVCTPSGYRPIGEIQAGDAVTRSDGHALRVLRTIRRTVPALGMFAPTRLRAGILGLQTDIIAAPNLRLGLGSSEAEYLFGYEHVHIPLHNVPDGVERVAVGPDLTVTYVQLLLAECDMLDVGGASVESLYVGRLGQQAKQLEASLFRDTPRDALPVHRAARPPVLSSFDATILADHCAA